ncbi:MAG: hypothetical protein IPL61_22570 [Myxococcales bacterium]|nr:hypothetical protein [Myxococcales bacterium]
MSPRRRGLVALALAAAACGGKRTPPPAPTAGDAATAVVVAAADAAAVDAADGVRIPDESRELVLVVVPDWDATSATVSHWRRAAGGSWQAVRAPWPAVIGHTGIAWGQGLHGDGAPAGRAGPIKREGDGRSPAGIFALGPTYGRAPTAPAGARVKYTAVTDRWRCVDDAASTHYNRVLDEDTVTKDWASAEDLRRRDHLYDWVVDVRHNPAAVPGGGSCIFLHVWRGPTDGTVGCTAMAAPVLAELIAGLDPAARPVLVQLPAAERAALAEAWGLPPGR